MLEFSSNYFYLMLIGEAADKIVFKDIKKPIMKYKANRIAKNKPLTLPHLRKKMSSLLVVPIQGVGDYGSLQSHVLCST